MTGHRTPLAFATQLRSNCCDDVVSVGGRPGSTRYYVCFGCGQACDTHPREDCPPQVIAPFTPDQVASLNAYQASGVFHEYTCGSEVCPVKQAVLVAAEDGWRCPAGCGYRQYWAHRFTADWSWRPGNDGGPVHHVSDGDASSQT